VLKKEKIKLCSSRPLRGTTSFDRDSYRKVRCLGRRVPRVENVA
jgi:hypothetical protein